MRRDIRIALTGDPGVGKSTLITSLIKESYVANVQRVLPEITLPPEVAPEGVITKIVDTSPAQDHRAHLEAELRRANVICIVYSISAPSSFDRIPNYWLPYIRSLGINVPIILVGNMIDLRSGDVTNAALINEVQPVMAEFKEVESCVECSAKIPINVPEVFFFAQKAVLYPTAPLYDSREHYLKPACVEALKRIFRLCDSDKDGVMSDNDLNEFQERCFGDRLQLQELEGIKQLVTEAPIVGHHYPYDRYSASIDTNTPSGSSIASNGSARVDEGGPSASRYQHHPHLRDGCLTLAGFLYLLTLFIRRGRLETTWAILRTFGYGLDLTLQDSFVRPQFTVPPECSVELSPHGYQFLTDIFEAFDKDRDGALCERELESLFATAPGGRHPWGAGSVCGAGYFPGNSTITDEHGAVTLQGWLAQWSMTTLLDHKTTLAYMAYLGYPSFNTGVTAHPSGGYLSSTASPASPSTPTSQYPGGTGSGGGWPWSSNKGKGKSSADFFGRTAGKAGKDSHGGSRSRAGTVGSHNGHAHSGGSGGGRADGGKGGGSGGAAAAGTGTPLPTTSALKVTNPRRVDRKKKGRIQRAVLLGFVLGAAGSGKTALLKAVIGKGFDTAHEPTQKSMSVVAAVEEAGAEKYLVLQEFGSGYEAETLRNTSKLSAADVIIYVYDSSDTNSFSYISNLRQQYPLLSTLPSLFVATKADLDLAQQRHEVQPDVYCRKLGLEIPGLGAGPLSLSVREGQLADVYNTVCAIALDPRDAVPAGAAKDRSLSYANSRARWLLYIGTVVLVCGGGAFVLFGWRGDRLGGGVGSVGLGFGRRGTGGGASSGGTTATSGESRPGWLSWLWGSGEAGAGSRVGRRTEL